MSNDPERRRRFETVVAEVHEPLRRYLGRRAAPADADDVLGDVLLVVWRRLDDVPDDAALPWCYGIARRCLANHRRADDRRLRLADRVGRAARPEPVVDRSPVDDSDPALEAALATLSIAEREIVHLWAWEQLEPREIAQVVERSSNAVSVALTRARRKLAAALTRQEPGAAGHVASARPDSDHRDRG